jgi:hypothetical protein
MLNPEQHLEALGTFSVFVFFHCALGISAIDPELADGGVDAALWLSTASRNIGACCAFILPVSNPHPLRDMLRPLQRT